MKKRVIILLLVLLLFTGNVIAEEIYQNSVNYPPLTNDIPGTATPLNLDLRLYAVDPENSQLTFFFQQTQSSNYDSQFTTCLISSAVLSCNLGDSEGYEIIPITVSDGVKSSTLNLNIFNQPKQALTETAPRADLGPDILSYPGQMVTIDASKATDVNNDLIFQDSSFIWKMNNQVIGQGITLLKRFDSAGVYVIDLEVKDSSGLIGKDQINIIVQAKNRCKNTTTSYFPQDTICNSEWPGHEGELVAINTRSQSCDLIEVCSEDLDYIIEDAIDCCDGSPLKDQKKSPACNFAGKYSQGSIKRCQGLYLIKGVGDSAIYMQDYFEAEMCCYGVESICNSPGNFYKAKPLPRTQKQENIQQIQCKTTEDNRVLGSWLSDSVLQYNNIALQDIHASATINVLGTGTCVDYSVSLTTLLRKAGYSGEEVFVAEASNHAYTLIRLPLDRKFHFVDTTGNNKPSIVLGSAPYNYPYCENLLNCYNDLGKQLCPEMSEIVGCEGVKEPFTRQASRYSFKTQKLVKGVVALFVDEVKR
ncbi:MAG TPA: hypothetical protein VJJ21_03965 [Candidatus Nanoarchaeia archaeon]|nr:hypothetical protein [Candidatus Nanoarchaeia archaeon]